MPRKARVAGGGSGAGTYTILMDKTRSATAGELWRCRVSGFKQPFFGVTPRAAALQAGQAIESMIEHRLTAGAAAASPQGRKATVRTRTRTRTRRQPQLAGADIL